MLTLLGTQQPVSHPVEHGSRMVHLQHAAGWSQCPSCIFTADSLNLMGYKGVLGSNWNLNATFVYALLRTPAVQALGGAALAHTGLSFVPSGPASSSFFRFVVLVT